MSPQIFIRKMETIPLYVILSFLISINNKLIKWNLFVFIGGLKRITIVHTQCWKVEGKRC